MLPGATPRALVGTSLGEKSDANLSPMRTLVAKLRTKLGEDARNPRYVITETRVGYFMPEGEGEKPSATP